jgi:cob(I)alamin adenosyltransferase
MKIYTGTGDAGETGLYGGQRVPKDDARVEAYGTVDETSAVLGIAVLGVADPELRETIVALQRELFTVGADLATPREREAQAGKSLILRIAPEQTRALEMTIDRYEATLTPLRAFIVPGGSPGSAALHQARAVARRAERLVVALYRRSPETMNAELLPYLNRLADLLFVLARAANRVAGVEDVPWTRPD